MRKRKIWESASRPLLVKSVWNEAYGGYRHFILDFEPQRRLSESTFKPRKVVFKPSNSYEEAEHHHQDALQLVGSIKPKSRPTPPIKIPKPASNIRKVVNYPPRTFFDFLKKRGAAIKEEHVSKRSSLQDLNPEKSSASDEQLAERVLNWLDLAGKTPLLRPNTAPDIPVKKASPVRKEKDEILPPVRTTTAVRRPDSVKHITIIFNKEGIPIRYNRPIRYTDLFRIGFNASRRFASTLAASKLRKLNASGDDTMVSSLPGNTAFDKAAMDLKRPKTKPTNMQRSFENDYRALINRKILEESCNLREMKKQLHIFMPSLPKKTNLTPADGASSMLSGAQSEQSKC